MKLTVPYHYQFSYVPTRCHNDRTGWGAATVDVEIRELGDGDAPVVMTVANRRVDRSLSRGCQRFEAKEDGSHRKVRMLNGLFYVEGYDADELRTRASNVETLNSTFLSRTGKHESSPGADPHEEREITSISALRYKRHVGGLREEKTRDDLGKKVGERIGAQASRMFVVDGKTYELCREPIFAYAKKQGDDARYGIVEAYGSTESRLTEWLYDNLTTFTSSLVHAGPLMVEVGVESSAVEFAVVDQSASTYDGVSSDIVTALTFARDKLEEAAPAASRAMLQAYYGLREALSETDLQSPSASREMIEAARAVIDITSDPDIEETMVELSNARYMTDTSGRPMPGGNPNKGTPFMLGLGHVSRYSKSWNLVAQARHYASVAVDRWEKRHPDSVCDNGQTSRLASRAESGLTVTEIVSNAQARFDAMKLGLGFAAVDNAIGSGSRLFRISSVVDEKDVYPARKKSNLLALVSGPPRAVPGGDWTVLNGSASREARKMEAVFIGAVADHVEAMDEIDEKNAQDKQLIAIF